MKDLLHRPESGPGLGAQLRESADWLIDLFFERAEEPAPATLDTPLQAKSCRFPDGRRIACVSLSAGCGTTTLAALLAQRSGGAGARVRLLDLDLVAPSLALLAGQRHPTLLDALAVEQVRGRRWGSADVVFGAERDPGPDVAPALARFVRRMAADAAVVVDAGALSMPGCETVLRACDVVLSVTTPRAAHVHAAVRAAAILEGLGIVARLVVLRADRAAADAIAGEVGLALAGVIPEDPFLARDEFRVRAETARAVDALCVALA